MLPRANPCVERIGGEDILTLTVEGQDFHFALVPGAVERLARQCRWQKPFKNGNVVELRPMEEDG